MAGSFRIKRSACSWAMKGLLLAKRHWSIPIGPESGIRVGARGHGKSQTKRPNGAKHHRMMGTTCENREMENARCHDRGCHEHRRSRTLTSASFWLQRLNLLGHARRNGRHREHTASGVCYCPASRRLITPCEVVHQDPGDSGGSRKCPIVARRIARGWFSMPRKTRPRRDAQDQTNWPRGPGRSMTPRGNARFITRGRHGLSALARNGWTKGGFSLANQVEDSAGQKTHRPHQPRPSNECS